MTLRHSGATWNGQATHYSRSGNDQRTSGSRFANATAGICPLDRLERTGPNQGGNFSSSFSSTVTRPPVRLKRGGPSSPRTKFFS